MSFDSITRTTSPNECEDQGVWVKIRKKGMREDDDNMVKKAIVPAAGAGTRLRPITDAIPKEMIRVGKKPAIEHVLMFLNSKIFDYIRKTEPGKKGERWLTDSIELMRKDGNALYGYGFDGKRFDIGTFESLREADRLEMERDEE